MPRLSVSQRGLSRSHNEGPPPQAPLQPPRPGPWPLRQGQKRTLPTPRLPPPPDPQRLHPEGVTYGMLGLCSAAGGWPGAGWMRPRRRARRERPRPTRRARRESSSGGAGRRPPLEDFGRHPLGGEPHPPTGSMAQLYLHGFRNPYWYVGQGVAWGTPWRILPERYGVIWAIFSKSI